MNTHEAQARARKALRLAITIIGTDVANVELLKVDAITPEHRRLIEKVAKVRPASDLTWSLVPTMIADMVRSEQAAIGRLAVYDQENSTT